MQCNTNSCCLLSVYVANVSHPHRNFICYFFYKEIDSMRLYPQKVCGGLTLYTNFSICEIQPSFYFIK